MSRWAWPERARCSTVSVYRRFREIAVAAEVEVEIARMELGGTSQGLAGADVAGTLLGVETTMTAMAWRRGNSRSRRAAAPLAAGVLIDAMQAHKGIEGRAGVGAIGDGRIQASAVGLKIEPHGGRGDDLDVEINGRLHSRDTTTATCLPISAACRPAHPLAALARTVLRHVMRLMGLQLPFLGSRTNIAPVLNLRRALLEAREAIDRANAFKSPFAAVSTIWSAMRSRSPRSR